jgi:hypothetical protein
MSGIEYQMWNDRRGAQGRGKAACLAAYDWWGNSYPIGVGKDLTTRRLSFIYHHYHYYHQDA